ncbi:MAG: hypothetical protein PHQ96_09310 [Candidatus Omnitrophica bacterium]|nr:hypothetical protein [Candidatus Omnitrophota bacterium]
MISRSNKSFSLLEVLIASAIITTALVFIFKAITISLTAAKFSQDITEACLLAQGRLWEIEQKYNKGLAPLADSGSDSAQDKEFNWNYRILDTGLPGLQQLRFTVSWQEKREKEYTTEFSTYILHP